MQHWTKNGSIPSTETDGTEGWQPAPSPPTDVPAGKELVWLNWEWIIRDPKPADRAGWQWNWQHESRTWVESAWQTELQPIEAIELPEIVVTTQLSGFTTSQISEIS
jgi:hypothetical protein